MEKEKLIDFERKKNSYLIKSRIPWNPLCHLHKPRKKAKGNNKSHANFHHKYSSTKRALRELIKS